MRTKKIRMDNVQQPSLARCRQHCRLNKNTVHSENELVKVERISLLFHWRQCCCCWGGGRCSSRHAIHGAPHSHSSMLRWRLLLLLHGKLAHFLSRESLALRRRRWHRGWRSRGSGRRRGTHSRHCPWQNTMARSLLHGVIRGAHSHCRMRLMWDAILPHERLSRCRRLSRRGHCGCTAHTHCWRWRLRHPVIRVLLYGILGGRWHGRFAHGSSREAIPHRRRD